MQVQLSVRAEAASPDARQPGSCLEKHPGARKKKQTGGSSFIWDMGSAGLIRDVWLPCNCTELGGKEDVAQGCVRRSIIRKACEALAGGEAAVGALCLVRDHASRKIQTNWKE